MSAPVKSAPPQTHAFEAARRDPVAGRNSAFDASVRAIVYASHALPLAGRTAGKWLMIARNAGRERQAYLDGAANA